MIWDSIDPLASADAYNSTPTTASNNSGNSTFGFLSALTTAAGNAFAASQAGNLAAANRVATPTASLSGSFNLAKVLPWLIGGVLLIGAVFLFKRSRA